MTVHAIEETKANTLNSIDFIMHHLKVSRIPTAGLRQYIGSHHLSPKFALTEYATGERY